ncbi:hypothetical protein [Comamonas kerstersii]|uniref:Uncharacterized protein n=1 Tax=Comamonas kerstersii TaxID=225992 RepID=A0A6A1QZZ1_9BURK|nr:hypothetical protein [Comamonas kerstersii]KAB0585516.1 hypothetical protein F7P80_13965 [Comamonas kerstersii]
MTRPNDFRVVTLLALIDLDEQKMSHKENQLQGGTLHFTPLEPSFRQPIAGKPQQFFFAS